jgi:hypothetical protein
MQIYFALNKYLQVFRPRVNFKKVFQIFIVRLKMFSNTPTLIVLIDIFLLFYESNIRKYGFISIHNGHPIAIKLHL